MTFQITSHNLEYVLDAYSNKKEPQTLVVPYDSFGNEVEISAPLREEVEGALQEYDVHQLMSNLPKDYQWHFGLYNTLIIKNKNQPEVTIEQIAKGLAIVHFGVEYSLQKSYDPETGFKRVVGYSRKNDLDWNNRFKKCA